MPSCPKTKHFPDRLLTWWDQYGRKDLPWQQPRSPYRVWVSEIMLQQTQVSTVIAYFERWMERFPQLPELAQASEDEVMGLWAGLGYYSRARNLHKAAKICLDRFEGNLPDTPKLLIELPGIGKSTANAIMSLAFNQPAAILDGNVKRVLARHAGIEGWPGQSKIMNQLWSEAESRLPKERAADYSQASMDLGAIVCTRNNPACTECPVSSDCEAFTLGRVDRIPAPRPKKEIPTRVIHVLIVRDENGRVLLERRPPSGIWGGLWSFPEVDSTDIKPGEYEESHKTLPELDHRLTHLHLVLKPVLVSTNANSSLESRVLRDKPDMKWFEPAEWHELGLPKPISKLLHQLMKSD